MKPVLLQQVVVYAVNEENRKIMRRTGLVFFLDAKFEDIYMRIKNDKNRPIVQNSTEQRIRASCIFTEENFIVKPDIFRVLTENRTLRQIVEYIAFQVNRLKGE